MQTKWISFRQTIDEYKETRRSLPRQLEAGLSIQEQYLTEAIAPYIVAKEKDIGKHICHIKGLALLYHAPRIFLKSYAELVSLVQEVKEYSKIAQGALDYYDNILRVVRIAAQSNQPVDESGNFMQRFLHYKEIPGFFETRIETLFQDELKIPKSATLEEAQTTVISKYLSHVQLITPPHIPPKKSSKIPKPKPLIDTVALQQINFKF